MKVLIVEDDAANVDLLRTRLKNLECQAIVAMDAEDGLSLAISEQPALILLDLKLDHTVTSGINLLEQLRVHPATAGIPVFIHSIYVARKGDMPEAQRLADGYLLKPFKFDDLKKIIAGFKAEAST